MSLSSFSFPTPTLFGPGAVTELPAWLAKAGLRRPLVVTDPGLLATEAFQQLERVLGAAGRGKVWHLFQGVHPNPVETDVHETAEAFRSGGCDCVVAFGGGSALDVGKASRLLLKRADLKLAEFRYQDGQVARIETEVHGTV